MRAYIVHQSIDWCIKKAIQRGVGQLSNETLPMSKTCYDIQTWFVQFTEKRKKAKM